MSRIEPRRLLALFLAGALVASGHDAQGRSGVSGGAPTRSGSTTVDDGREGLVAGMVGAQKKISNGVDDFPDALDDYSMLGTALAALGDLDGDGFGDLAVGVGDGLTSTTGAVWILFLDADQDVKAAQKIAQDRGGFSGQLDHSDWFGSGLAALGDVDGDGVVDLAVGAPGDDGAAGGQNADFGALWVLLLRPDGTVKAQQKICEEEGGFPGVLVEQAELGSSLAALGDFDGDGVVDLLIGIGGAVSALLLHSDGSVKAQVEIGGSRPGRARRDTGPDGGLLSELRSGSRFGPGALATLGDLDGNGVVDLAVGNSGHDSGRGAIAVAFLRSDGTVKAYQEIDEVEGGFTGELDSFDYFGMELAALGDLDGDGLLELAVSAQGDDDGGSNSGAVWILSLRADGTVARNQKISATQGGLIGALSSDDRFGTSLAAPGDVDGDGIADLSVGATGDDDGGPERGAVWLLHLEADATVESPDKISDTQGGFVGTLEAGDRFGSSVARIGDLDGDGVSELVVGAKDDDDGGANAGAVWVLFLDAEGFVQARRKISATQGGFTGTLGVGDGFGGAVAALGDLDGDGTPDLAVGAPGHGESGGPPNNAVWVLFLEADGTVRAQQEIGVGHGGFAGTLGTQDRFGASLAALGDLDGDGSSELAVGGPWSSSTGTVWVLHLAADGTVAAQHRIAAGEGGFVGSLTPSGQFGSALAAVGDLDGDGLGDLAVGQDGDAFSPVDGGALWLLFLAADGTVRDQHRIAANEGGFLVTLFVYDGFGASIAALGDLDGDGVEDLAVGAPGTDIGPGAYERDFGVVWILLLQADGTVKAWQEIGHQQGGFTGELATTDHYGGSLSALGDLDGDGVPDLVVGVPQDDDGGENHGALWVLSLDGIATLDFEGGDDQERTPFVDGQDLSPASGFGRTLELTSSGANLGPAIFDSTPGGPNDPGPGGGLLVDQGMLLVLQDPAQPAQTSPGVFDQPLDARGGGTITLGFQARIEPRSLDLVDISSVSGTPSSPRSGRLGRIDGASRVRLLDASNRSRVYSVPMNWTEPLGAQGSTGFRTLDLTTLDPQPGFASTARASETPGFDSRAVVRIEVELAGPGALDNLRWIPAP